MGDDALTFRAARAADVPAIIELLRADSLGAGRELQDLAVYEAAFERIAADPNADVIVGEAGGRVVATYHLNILHGLSRGASTRAHVEAVRVDASLRGQGAGRALMADAEARARTAGATLIQLTSDATRPDAHAFYEALGFTPSHIGFKRSLPSGD